MVCLGGALLAAIFEHAVLQVAHAAIQRITLGMRLLQLALKEGFGVEHSRLRSATFAAETVDGVLDFIEPVVELLDVLIK